MINAIVYVSNAGHTKAYAGLLGDEINLPVYELSEAKEKLSAGTEIIYLGWLMAGTVKGYEKAKKSFEVRALCPVGMSGESAQLNDIRKTNTLPEDLPLFVLQGGFEIEKLHGIYKLMLSTMQKTVGKGLADKKDRTPEEDEMLDLMLNGGSKVNKSNLTDIVNWYKSLN